MKKLYKVMLPVMLVFGLAQAATVTLDVLDNNINVGETFDVEVWVDGEGIGEALLAFGFDVATPGTFFSYSGYTIESGFFDASDPFNSVNVAGAGEGLSDDLQLATLSFNAMNSGTDTLAVNGIFDGFFDGLFYETSGLDIVASRAVTINQAIPEPQTIFLMIIGLASFCTKSKRMRGVARDQWL